MTRLHVRVTPRASRNAITTIDLDGVVHVRVTAAPTDGQANEAVRQLLAKSLGLAPRDVMLASGAVSRQKTFEVPLTIEEARARIQGA